jgi:hypothetical protein
MSDIGFSVRKSDMSNYDQSNDYSDNGVGTNAQPSNKVTVYIDGRLVFGEEP